MPLLSHSYRTTCLRNNVFMPLKKNLPQALRVVGEMIGADEIMHQAIFLGTYPGLTKEMLAHEIAVIRDFVRSKWLSPLKTIA